MARQIASGLGTASIPLLEERIRQLETRVALLTHAVQALAREVEKRKDKDEEPR